MHSIIVSQTKNFSTIKNTFDFFTDLGYVENGKFLEGLYVTFETKNEAFVTEDIEKYTYLFNADTHNFVKLETVRTALSIHKDRKISYKTFQKTKILCLIDLDEAVEFEQLLKAVESLEFKPVYVKRTYKGWHLIYTAQEWQTNTDILNSLSKILFEKALPHLEQLVKDRGKIENKPPMLAQTRIINDKLFCLKVRDFYSQEEILNILNKTLKPSRKEKDFEYIALSDITLESLDKVFSTCKVLQELDNSWEYHSYNEWVAMANYLGLRFLAGDEKAFEEFIEKSKNYPDFTLKEATEQFNKELEWIKKQEEKKEGFLYSCKRYQEISGSDEHCRNCLGFPFVYAKVLAGAKTEGLDKKEILVFNNSLNWIKAYIKDRGFITYNNWQDILNITDKLDSKICYLLFNTLQEASNKALELAGALYGKGVADVRIVVYSKTEGETLKEVLERAEDKQERLNLLLAQSIEVFDYIKEEIKNSKEIMKKFLQVALIDKDTLEGLLDILKVKGYNKTEAREIHKELINEKKEKEKQKTEAEVKKLFGSNYKLPSGFYLRDNELIGENKAITIFFIVSKVYKSVEGKTFGYEIKTINGKSFILSIEDLSRSNIIKAFNEHDIPTGDYGGLLMNYLTAFVRLNEAIIPTETISDFVGWYNGDYLLPQIAKGVKFEVKGYSSKGRKEEELRLLKEIIEDGNILGVGYLSGISALLIEPLQTKNFVVFLSGTAGSGKTTTGAVGLSLFGDYQTLMKNFNYTTAGLEILLNKNKDVVVVLDELNTSNKDITLQLINTVYNFQNGTGRTRATTKLGLRDTATYRGVLIITSENDINQLLEASNTITRGALRRVLQFEYTEKVDRELIQRVYNTIKEHHGNLIKDIVDYIKNHKQTLKTTYQDYVKELSEKYNLKDGIELYTATMLTALEILEKLYNINTATMIATVLNFVKAYQEDIKDEMAITKEKLEEKITGFVYENMQNFIISDMQQTLPKNIYGKIDEDCIYITRTAFKHLAKYVKLGERSFKKLLANYGLAESDGKRIIKNACFRFAGLQVGSFKINLAIKDKTNNNINNIANNEEEEIDF